MDGAGRSRDGWMEKDGIEGRDGKSNFALILKENERKNNDDIARM